MAHYAQIDDNNIVVQVIVSDQDTETLEGVEGRWIKTSYNTQGGVHLLGGTPLRKNFAGIGHTYDEERDAFIPQKGYDSWVLNEETCQWEAPTSYPTDGGRYNWDEETVSWVERTE